jgi:hypothetical protein
MNGRFAPEAATQRLLSIKKTGQKNGKAITCAGTHLLSTGHASVHNPPWRACAAFGAPIRKRRSDNDSAPPSAITSPDEKTKKAMKAAVVDAYFYMLQQFTQPQPEHFYWPDRRYIVYFGPDAKRGWWRYLRSWRPDAVLARPLSLASYPVATGRLGPLCSRSR